MTKVKDLPPDLQPREKLAEYGADSLDLSELMAVILATGYKKENVLELSERVFSSYGSKAITAYNQVEEVMKDFHLPPVKSMQILACLEIGKRLYVKNEEFPLITSPQDVWNYVWDMTSFHKEHLRGLYLNTKRRIIHDEIISIGTLDQSIAHPRDIYRPALIHVASAMILVHNHPSGDLTPSEADIQITNQVKQAGEILSIPCLDHIIVSRAGYRQV